MNQKYLFEMWEKVLWMLDEVKFLYLNFMIVVCYVVGFFGMSVEMLWVWYCCCEVDGGQCFGVFIDVVEENKCLWCENVELCKVNEVFKVVSVFFVKEFDCF